MGRTLGMETVTESATTTSAVFACPDNCTMLLIRASAANTDDIYIKIDDFTSSSSDIILKAGEFISFDLSDSLHIKMAMGFAIQYDDYFRQVAYTSASGTQSVEIDSFGIKMPIIR